MNLQRLVIDISGNFKFIIEPRDNIIYKVNDPRIHTPDRLVVIYKLTFIDYTKPDGTPERQLESFISYYMSDAKTNNFRTNLLLPFLCMRDEEKSQHNTKENNDTGCLLTTSLNDNHPRGLLYKVAACNHLNFRGLEKSINDVQEVRNIRMHAMLNAESARGNGVMSVLSRMQNIVDFMIGITSKKLTNFNDTYIIPEALSKMTDPTIIIENRIDKTQITNQQLIEANFTSYNGIEQHIPGINIYDENFQMLDIQHIDVYMLSEYRRMLLKLVLRFNRMIRRNPHINLTYIPATFQDSTVREINQRLLICQQNAYTDSSQRSYIEYKRISNLINMKIREIKEVEQYKEFKELFDPILIPLHHLTCTNDTLESHMFRGWKSECNTFVNRIKSGEPNLDDLYIRLEQNTININNVDISYILLLLFRIYRLNILHIQTMNSISEPLRTQLLDMAEIVAKRIYYDNNRDIIRINEFTDTFILQIYKYDQTFFSMLHPNFDNTNQLYKKLMNEFRMRFKLNKLGINMLYNKYATLNQLDLNELREYESECDKINNTISKLKEYLDINDILLEIRNDILLRVFIIDKESLELDYLRMLVGILTNRIAILRQQNIYPMLLREYEARIQHVERRITELMTRAPQRPQKRQVVDNSSSPLSKRRPPLQPQPGGGYNYQEKYNKYKQKYLELKKMMKKL
jgi:hypothetical protein